MRHDHACATRHPPLQTLARELNVPATVAQDVLDTVLGPTEDNHRQPAQRYVSLLDLNAEIAVQQTAHVCYNRGVPKGRLRAVSAADLLKMPSKPRIVTMSRALDQLLGGGVVVCAYLKSSHLCVQKNYFSLVLKQLMHYLVVWNEYAGW